MKLVAKSFRNWIIYSVAFGDSGSLAVRSKCALIEMNTKMYIVCGFLTIVILAGSVATLSAAGFRLPDQDAFATARGEAFAATADNASAIDGLFPVCKRASVIDFGRLEPFVAQMGGAA